ncbi:hypothetical protein [Pseudotenacibaculum haliotis]|uniref:Lipocalin-like domain-containing protein n=1 Tax=Pseudotenacibaculum haliotis TaxID=1862138 RepID=A0ABW5LPW5_9FLAO
MKKLYFLFLMGLFVACQQNNAPTIDPNNLLVGVWGNATYDNERLTFERISSLPSDQYAVAFYADFTFIQRTSGWCGTPPLTYSNEEGTWSSQDELVSVNSGGYPGNFQWSIELLDNTTLIVKRVLSEQEQDHRALMDLFDEIYTIATSVSCTNSSDWSYTPYGEKACGGPQGYLAYSNQIDVPDFLAKVEAYRQAEEDYNTTWQIVSTCDLPQQPTGVSCVNGNAVLNY